MSYEVHGLDALDEGNTAVALVDQLTKGMNQEKMKALLA